MAKEKSTRELVMAKLSQIKKLVFEEQEVKAEDVKTVDGSILVVEPSVEVGATASVIDEDGELTPVADGQTELEDGTVITIEDGVIVEVQVVEDETKEEEINEDEANPTEDAPAFNLEKLQEQIINKLNVAITEKIEKLRFAKAEEVEKLTSENKELREGLKGLIGIVEKFAATPKEEPKKKIHNPFRKDDSTLDYSQLLKN